MSDGGFAMAAKAKVHDDQTRLAVLIDADNAQPSVIEGLLAEVAKFGVASVKRIYGDWTSTSHTQWKHSLLKHSISPVQQFAYTKGKNATDCTLIIDAMDLMYTRRFDGFCLVSSDSDFTRLAQRLREEGLTVYGFGEKKTPDPFVQACDKFIYTEVLRPDSAQAKAHMVPNKIKAAAPTSKTARPESVPAAVAEPVVAETKDDKGFPIDLVRLAIEDASDDAGWAHLSSIGSYLTKVRPDFDPRLYGHKKLSDLLRKYPKAFALEERGAPGASSRPIYVRVASQRKSGP
jgi:hypothetical protein